MTDQELIDHYKNDQNNKWIGILLERYTMLLLGVCMKYLKNEDEAKDAVQQVFLKALIEIPKYEISFFKSWIYMVAKNHCLMKLRSNKGKYAVEFTDEFIKIEDNGKKLETLLKEDLTLDILEKSIEELNSEQKICIDLFYLQKKSYQETADETGFTLMQVKSYIQNGKRNLRLNIENKLNQNSKNEIKNNVR